MKILYFTATGNNLYLAKKLGGELYSIPKLIKEGIDHISDDKIGLVFPVFSLSVPPYIENFLKNVKLESDYIFAVMSYGMHDGAATTHLIDIGNRNGINFAYINRIIMVDNYLPIYNMQTQIKNEPKKEIDKHLSQIITDINSSKQWTIKDSAVDKFMTRRIVKAQKKTKKAIIAEAFLVEDSCTKCAVCAKVCPVDNIQVKQASPEFGDNCISCLACIQNCPQNTIYLKKEKNRSRFRNQHIKLKEIIDAND